MQALLKKTILPGLLDGRLDGAVLKDFPDLELADSLCLLLDLEAAAPEVVTAALTRLELPAERHATMLPLLESRVQTKVGAASPDSTVDSHARRLLKIDRERAKNVAEFAAFDLSIDDETRQQLCGVYDAIDLANLTTVQLDCLWSLTRLEPNPEARRSLRCPHPDADRGRRAKRRRGVVCHAGWPDCRGLADAVIDARPDVAEVLQARLASHVHRRTGRVAARLVRAERARQASRRPSLQRWVPQSATRSSPCRQRRAEKWQRRLLCEHAALLAPALAAQASRRARRPTRRRPRARVRRSGTRNGPWDTAAQRGRADRARSAPRACAGSARAQAAALVASSIQEGRGWIGSAAEQTLWHFPKAEADRQVIGLLSRRDFVVRQPDAAGRLIDHAPREHANTVAILQPLQSLSYRIWNPALARIGRKARALLLAGRSMTDRQSPLRPLRDRGARPGVLNARPACTAQRVRHTRGGLPACIPPAILQSSRS